MLKTDRYSTYKGGNVNRKIDIKAHSKGFVINMTNSIGFPVGGVYAFSTLEEVKLFLHDVINDFKEGE